MLQTKGADKAMLVIGVGQVEGTELQLASTGPVCVVMGEGEILVEVKGIATFVGVGMCRT